MSCKAPLAYVDKAGFVWPWGQPVPASFKADVKWLCTVDEIKPAYERMMKIMNDRKNDVSIDTPPEQREMASGFSAAAQQAVLGSA
jgi:hypothetical protein